MSRPQLHSARPQGVHRARHRAATRSAGVGAGVLAAAAGAVLLAGPASATAGDPFAVLRQCESGGNYAINTGNGYYGAYQFDIGTWQAMGQSGLPSSASPATQDAAARALQAQRGWAPWPGCRASRGLDGYSVAPAAAPAPAPAPAAPPVRAGQVSRSLDRASLSTAVFTVAMVGQVRDDVRAWQQQMVSLGHPITVDGQYGPQSAQATHDFEVAHGLSVESPGQAGPQVRAAMAQALTAR